MNLPFDIRIGNIIDYSGVLGNYNNARVIDITALGDGTQVFTLARPYNEEKTFVGYVESISPIFLREGHLNVLGFKSDDKLKKYIHDNITIGSFGYSEGNDRMNLTYVSLGFRVIPTGFPDIPTIEQVKSNTVKVPYLHSLQNYCNDNGIAGLDFGLIKW